MRLDRWQARRRCRFFHLKCSTEQLQQSLSRRDAPELKSEFLSSKSEANRNTQSQKSKSKTNSFGILCFWSFGLVSNFGFRIGKFISTWRAVRLCARSVKYSFGWKRNIPRQKCYLTGQVITIDPSIKSSSVGMSMGGSHEIGSDIVHGPFGTEILPEHQIWLAGNSTKLASCH